MTWKEEVGRGQTMVVFMRASRNSSVFEDSQDTMKFSQKGSIVLLPGFMKVNLAAFWRLI